MLGLAHRILSQSSRLLLPNDIRSDCTDSETTNTRVAANVIAKSTIVKATNVAEYFFSQDKKTFDSSDFPNVAPPFMDVFIEWEVTPGMSWIFDSESEQPCTQCGTLLQWRPIIGISSKDSVKFGEIFGEKIDAAKWILCARNFLSLGGSAASDCVPIYILVDHRGTPIKGKSYLIRKTTDDDNTIQHAWRVAVVSLLSVSFMHCKNVIRTDAEGPPDKWLRRQKQPKLRYHVLQIDPMKEVLRREGGSETNGLKKALHICRGHFATYTDEKPLFGRSTGTFWKPAHVRGSSKEGVVVKDYAVNAPSS